MEWDKEMFWLLLFKWQILPAIVNRGWYFTPHIVKSIDGKPNPDERFKKNMLPK